MRLGGRTLLTLAFVVDLTVACGGDPYEGGGRRRELPMSSSQAQTPDIGPGDGSSTTGGTSPAEGGAAGAGAVGGGGTAGSAGAAGSVTAGSGGAAGSAGTAGLPQGGSE